MIGCGLVNGRVSKTLDGNTRAVIAIDITPTSTSGKRAASIGEDGALRVWDLAKGIELSDASPPSGSVTAIAVTANDELEHAREPTAIVCGCPRATRRLVVVSTSPTRVGWYARREKRDRTLWKRTALGESPREPAAMGPVRVRLVCA